jgi:tRNA-splicing ligase RtcB
MYVIGTGRLPIKLWASVVQHTPDCDTSPNELTPIEATYCSCQRGVLQQFHNLANHPLAFKHIGGMPDYHKGFGMPIGGVLATQGGVIPNAVGVDIGCGMIAVPTQWNAAELSKDTLAALRLAIHRRVPCGEGVQHQEPQTLSPVLEVSATGVQRNAVYAQNIERARLQLGTLGAGNHFIEIQKAEDSWRVWIMIHSGSRGIGHKVCTYYNKLALTLMDRFKSAIPDRELAFLPDGIPEFQQYLDEMRWCMEWAEENRLAMLRAVGEAFTEVVGEAPRYDADDVVDTHHNFVAMERHFGQNVWVHRKGAVKAEGLVTIPGSMGTASYIGRGLEPRESFNTCAHGAGRVMSRKLAKATISHEDGVEAMKHVVYGFRQGETDEMPRAYKDIEVVMAAQTDLVTPVRRLLPLTVVKG